MYYDYTELYIILNKTQDAYCLIRPNDHYFLSTLTLLRALTMYPIQTLLPCLYITIYLNFLSPLTLIFS